MTSEEHEAIARRFFEQVWNQQKLEAIDDIFAATVVFNGQPVARDALWRPSHRLSRHTRQGGRSGRGGRHIADELNILQQLGHSFG